MMCPSQVTDSLPETLDYRIRRGEISAYGRALTSSKRLAHLTLAVALMLGVLLTFLMVFTWPLIHPISIIFAAVLAFSIGFGLWLIHRYTTQNFIEPDLAFRFWLQQVCDGELDARIRLESNHRHFKELDFHTKNLASSLRRLSDNMDELVESQTKRLNDKKRVLELLLRITADVSSKSGVEAAFDTVCKYLADWFESTNVSCYRVDPDEDFLRCVSSRTHATHDTDSLMVVPCNRSRLSKAQIPSSIKSIPIDQQNGISERWVPFFAGDEPAGVLIIKLQQAGHSERIETRRVLSTVAEQLSLLCSKQLVQEQVLSARLSRDRNELAAEIHDSLAQTLLAVRYQATLLGEKLKTQSHLDAFKDVKKMQGSIEEANEEVRGLIRENRSPLSEHRHADSLQRVIEQFTQSSGVAVFFQSDDPGIRFLPREESVLQRIIVEALNNAKKYASASMIRVYLRRSSSGVRRILVEDDGVGFQQSVPSDRSTLAADAGEHIGLAIMRDRALSIGAKLTIDSEPGEGTRISITVPPLIESQRDSR